MNIDAVVGLGQICGAYRLTWDGEMVEGHIPESRAQG